MPTLPRPAVWPSEMHSGSKHNFGARSPNSAGPSQPDPPAAGVCHLGPHETPTLSRLCVLVQDKSTETA